MAKTPMEIVEFLRKQGAKGGRQRAKVLTAEERSAIARKGAKASAKVRKAKAKVGQKEDG